MQNPKFTIQSSEFINQNPKSKVANPEFTIQNSIPGFEIRNSQFKVPIQRFKFGIRNSKFKVQNPKPKIRNSQFKVQNPKSKVPNPQPRVGQLTTRVGQLTTRVGQPSPFRSHDFGTSRPLDEAMRLRSRTLVKWCFMSELPLLCTTEQFVVKDLSISAEAAQSANGNNQG